MANAIFGFGLSHALEGSSVLVLKNSEILKVTVEKKEIGNGILLPATSILPKLLPYLAGCFDCAQQPLLALKVLECSNFGNMPPR
jgi:hypothetical protein